MPRTLNCLHSAEGRHAHLDSVALSVFGQQLKQIPDGGCGGIAARAGGQRLGDALAAGVIRNPLRGHGFTVRQRRERDCRDGR